MFLLACSLALFFCPVVYCACTHPCAPVPPNNEECLHDTNLGQELCIVNGSVILMPTYHAVVNAANSQLQNAGGVAAGFVQCGGQEIQTQCNAIIAKNGDIPVSQNAVTDAGCLPNRDLINAVGPRWDAARATEVEQELTNCVYNIIRTARMLCDEEVALPLISAGIFGFGAEKSAEILTKAALDFYLYWYETVDGKYSQDVIEQAVNTTRFKPPRSCPNQLMPRKVTIVGFYETSNDMSVLRKAMARRQAELNSLRSSFPGTGTYTESEASRTLAPTPAPTPAPTGHHGECGGMECWALALLIIVLIIVICLAIGLGRWLSQSRQRRAYIPVS